MRVLSGNDNDSSLLRSLARLI